MARQTKAIRPAERGETLALTKNLKMARSAHAYVRGNTKQFYDWLLEEHSGKLPEGPPIWICGDCHIGNLGPTGNMHGSVDIQIRDFDQTVIGNPAHDLIRLGLSLAMAARGSDLPGIITALMVEQLIDGYTEALEAAFDSESTRDFTKQKPESIHLVLTAALNRSWKQLAYERLKGAKPTLPIGAKFWRLSAEEAGAIRELFERQSVSRLATMLGSRDDDETVRVRDSAYWVKGCSSLGKLRYAVVLQVGHGTTKQYCLMDIKEAVPAQAPSVQGRSMPSNHGSRVVEGARHLSPHLGERMINAELLGRPVFVRELLPQDLKVEISELSEREATRVARYLAAIVGKAHVRQMSRETARLWRSELRKSHSKSLDAPSWLWNSIVSLVAAHEGGYLDHCRRYSVRGLDQTRFAEVAIENAA